MTFLNIVSNSGQKPVSESRVNFKKNIKILKQKFEEDEEVSKESHWFVNEEDRPIFRGPDFTTRDEDLLKLIKYMRGNFTKGDFYRYDTDPQKDFDVKTLIFCTEQMKERYLIYRDVVALCSCQSANSADSEDRFRLSGVCFYGVNSNGRNVIFGIALGKEISCSSIVTPRSSESLEFAMREFFYYMGKLPKALIVERNTFGCDFAPSKI